VGGACGTCGNEVRWIQVGGKPKGKTPLGRPKRRWKDNIKIAFQEMAWWGKGVNWTDLAQARDAWRTCERGNEPSDTIKRGECIE
jgi:hypothetical protein